MFTYKARCDLARSVLSTGEYPGASNKEAEAVDRLNDELEETKAKLDMFQKTTFKERETALASALAEEIRLHALEIVERKKIAAEVDAMVHECIRMKHQVRDARAIADLLMKGILSSRVSTPSVELHAGIAAYSKAKKKP